MSPHDGDSVRIATRWIAFVWEPTRTAPAAVQRIDEEPDVVGATEPIRAQAPSQALRAVIGLTSLRLCLSGLDDGPCLVVIVGFAERTEAHDRPPDLRFPPRPELARRIANISKHGRSSATRRHREPLLLSLESEISALGSSQPRGKDQVLSANRSSRKFIAIESHPRSLI